MRSRRTSGVRWLSMPASKTSLPCSGWSISPEDRKVVVRARRLQRFLTQPFFTTEQFTGLKGKLVSLADALDGCERILHDEFAAYPESALYMIGAIGEAKMSAAGTSSATSSRPEPVAAAAEAALAPAVVQIAAGVT